MAMSENVEESLLKVQDDILQCSGVTVLKNSGDMTIFFFEIFFSICVLRQYNEVIVDIYSLKSKKERMFL